MSAKSNCPKTGSDDKCGKKRKRTSHPNDDVHHAKRRKRTCVSKRRKKQKKSIRTAKAEADTLPSHMIRRKSPMLSKMSQRLTTQKLVNLEEIHLIQNPYELEAQVCVRMQEELKGWFECLGIPPPSNYNSLGQMIHILKDQLDAMHQQWYQRNDTENSRLFGYLKGTINKLRCILSHHRECVHPGVFARMMQWMLGIKGVWELINRQKKAGQPRYVVYSNTIERSSRKSLLQIDEINV